jgi:ABC-type nickel/cobalt efflux system permease component RcnA
MINLLAILAVGFLLGTRHATDPDHVVAVTTIVTRERNLNRSTVVGILWGFGHTLTILLVGGAIILFGLVIPPRLGLAMEFSVGLMLILLGMFNLNPFGKSRPEPAAHRTEGTGPHFHFHRNEGHPCCPPRAHNVFRRAGNENDHPDNWLIQTFCALGLFHTLRPVLVGIVHGLAGSAAVALLILTTISDPVWAMAYLVVFGIGTIAGMALITTAIAIPSVYGARRFARINRYLVISSGLLSVGLGLFLAYRIGITNGLLTSRPAWVPK